MAFKDLQAREQGVQLLQRSLARGRLGHAYLFSGSDLDELETLARTLAKTLNCRQPVRAGDGGPATDCCDACPACRKIDNATHADVHWIRPESKTRVITIEQIRDLSREIYLKPGESACKVAIVVAADRMNPQAANSFLKTLEEPPPSSVLLLLSTDPSRLLETILSRCLRLHFGGAGSPAADAAQLEWLERLGELEAGGPTELIGRYRLLDELLRKLAAVKEEVEKQLTERSPLQRYEELDSDLEERWEKELAAAIEAEYRRRRDQWLLVAQWWMRDVWLRVVGAEPERLAFPDAPATARLAGRLTPHKALENLRILDNVQRLLHTNVQEALALEVAMLRLHL